MMLPLKEVLSQGERTVLSVQQFFLLPLGFLDNFTKWVELRMRSTVLHVLSSFSQCTFFEMAVSSDIRASQTLSGFMEHIVGLPVLDRKKEKDVYFVVLIPWDFEVNVLPSITCYFLISVNSKLCRHRLKPVLHKRLSLKALYWVLWEWGELRRI